MADQKQGVTWDLTSFFPEFNGPQMLEYKQKLDTDIKQLQVDAAELAPLAADTADAWEGIILRTEAMDARLTHIFAYVGCLRAADANSEEYNSEYAKLMRLLAEYEKFTVDILQAFKEVTDEDFDAFLAREALKGVEHPLRKVREKALHTMSPKEEKLTADLNTDGLRAWGRLYDNVSGKLEFDMALPGGKVERKPISQWRALMSDVDREIGKAAFEGGNRAW